MKRGRIDETGSSFVETCRTASFEVVQALIAAQEENFSATDQNGRNALMAVCQRDDDDQAEHLVRLLLPICSFRLVDDAGQTALSYAARWSPLTVVQTLLNAGGNAIIRMRDSDGESPLARCCLRCDDEAPAILRLLCEAGADLNTRGRDSWPPLFHALMHGSYDVCDTLCILGCDVNCFLLDGTMAMTIAAQSSIDAAKKLRLMIRLQDCSNGCTAARKNQLGLSGLGAAYMAGSHVLKPLLEHIGSSKIHSASWGAPLLPGNECPDPIGSLALMGAQVSNRAAIDHEIGHAALAGQGFTPDYLWAHTRYGSGSYLRPESLLASNSSVRFWHLYLPNVVSYRTPAGDSVLSLACRTNVFDSEADQIKVVKHCMELNINPHVVGARGLRAIDYVAEGSAVDNLLSRYAEWRPESTWWFGPYFLRRAKCMLMAINRYMRMPRELREILTRYLARTEYVWVPRQAWPDEPAEGDDDDDEEEFYSSE